MALSRYDWSIKDVVKATGLRYHYVRRALLSGDLDGLIAARLLRTNERAVAKWLSLLRISHSPAPPATAPSTGRKPRQNSVKRLVVKGMSGTTLQTGLPHRHFPSRPQSHGLLGPLGPLGGLCYA